MADNLFIANPTTKNFEFTFRLPERNDINMILIRPGAQELVLKNAPPENIEKIIRDASPYGLISELEVKRHTGLISLIYSLGKQVNIGVMMVAQERNQYLLTLQGAHQRRMAAVGSNRYTEEKFPGVADLVRVQESSVFEESRPGASDPMKHTVAVAPRGDAPAPARKRRKAA